MNTVDGPVNIITCLEVVCQAFRDGGAIVEKVKIKRSQKKAPPPPRLLEESIDAAPRAIEKEKYYGLERFGKVFEDGDIKAIITLQQIALQLQGSLLEKLRNAAFDDDFKITDFTPLVRVADKARDRVIAALDDFKQRLIYGDPQRPALDQSMASTANSSVSNLEIAPRPSLSEPLRSSTEATLPLQHASTITTRPFQPRTWTRDFNLASDEDTASGTEDVRPSSLPRKRTSLLQFLRQNRPRSGSEQRYAQAQENALVRTMSTSPSQPHHMPPLPHKDSSERSKSIDSTQASPSNTSQHEWTDSQTELWSSKSSGERRDTAIAPDIAMSSPGLPMTPPSPNRVRTNTSSIGQYSSPGSSIQYGSPGSSVQYSNSIITAQYTNNVPTPTPDNDYLGFCKSAWKLQNGDKRGSMQKLREGDAWSMSGSGGPIKMYLACSTSKCGFRSNITNQNADLIWDKVFAAEGKGIKFRWRFLAKSHVHQKVSPRNIHSFKCMFCVFLQEECASNIYTGMEALLQHLTQHRGVPLNDVILYKAGCINDHVARIDEDFDINLWPLTPEESRDRGHPEPQEDEDAAKDPRQDAADSVLEPSEPWNEGLSNFHYSEWDPDRMELE